MRFVYYDIAEYLQAHMLFMKGKPYVREVNVVKYKNTLTHLQFQTEASVYLSKNHANVRLSSWTIGRSSLTRSVSEETTRTVFSCADWLRSIFYCY